jgi:hypothetical protein
MKRELVAIGTMVVAMTAIPGPGETRQAGIVREHVGGLDQINPTQATLRFGGQFMTDARAREIAGAAGFALISWQSCAPAASGPIAAPAQGCAIFEVQDKQDDRIFRYIVSDRSCVDLQIDRNTTTQVNPTQEFGGRKLRRSRQATQIATPSSTREAVARPGATAEVKSTRHCFGGFTALLRARQHNHFSVDQVGYIFKNEEIYQVLEQDRWTRALTVTATGWEAPLGAGSGMHERGYAYAWLDKDDTVLASDEDIVNWIASSGSTDKPSRRDMCSDQRDTHRSKLNVLAETAQAACLVIPVPDEIEASFEPGGVGIGGTKNLDYCGLARNVSLAVVDLAAQSTYNDCMKNPGRYDAANFPPEPGKYSLEGYLGFEPLAPQEITLTGNCPITQTTQSSWQVGGTVCTTDTKYVCGMQDSKCTCQQASQETVCTGGPRSTP